MGVPKRRHSNERTRLRRAHDFLKLKSPSKCANCGASILPHRVCPLCGFYRGRQLITMKVKKTKKET